jgi:hypothetical protein
MALARGVFADSAWAVGVDCDDFAGIKLADEFSTDGGKSATLGGNNPTALADFAETQWVYTPWVAEGVEGIASEDGKTVCAFGFVHERIDTLIPTVAGAASEELDDELTIA